jgi:glycine cleavage system H protein
MSIPSQLRYSTDHEWVLADGPRVRIGVTDYAQEAMGDVVFVEVPEIGAEVALGDSLGEVESTKSVSDIYAPVSGTVVAINEALAAEPGALNDDPYGAGWICEIQLSDVSQIDLLLDAVAYGDLIRG